jgi:acyl-coenzyme A thioesterase 13
MVPHTRRAASGASEPGWGGPGIMARIIRSVPAAHGTVREAMSEIPAGFEPSRRTSPFLDLIGPVYTSNGERGILLGLRARTEHLNTRGFVHGAILAALLDVICGRNCAVRIGQPGLVTVSLTVDYVASAREGDWLEASATVTRVGRRLAFAHGRVEAAGKPVATASGVFVVG